MGRKSQVVILRSLAASILVLICTQLFAHKVGVWAQGDSFTFATVGDIGGGSGPTAVLNQIGIGNNAFTLALGDLSYNNKLPEQQWCDWVMYSTWPALTTPRFVGSTSYPFQIVAGNHDLTPGSGAYIDEFAACLPDRLNSSGTYAREYYFDYPAADPLARVILISPNMTFADTGLTQYTIGNAHYNWLVSAIDNARANDIPWVIVGMHENCLSLGNNPCEIGQDLMNLLVDKRVDLVLQGHDHNYQRTKQLSCAKIQSYNAACVANAGPTYNKGYGNVIVISGTGGGDLYPINGASPQANYFAATMGYTGTTHSTDDYGYLQVTVSPSSLSGQFIHAVGPGSFTDSFSIVDNGDAPEQVASTLLADAYLAKNSGTSNYGSDSQLFLDEETTKEDILLKFSVPGIAGRQVVRATLRMYATDSSNNGGVVNQAANTTWDESLVTWNASPATSGGSVGSFGSVVTGYWQEADLSPSVIGADGLVSLRITSTSTDSAAYTSKEGGLRTPQLLVWVVQVAPPAPSGLSATQASQTGINLTWADNSLNEASFSIERSNDGSTGWAEIGTVAANVTSYSDTTLSCGQTRHYRVLAQNEAGSNTSNIANATTVVCNPAAPSGLHAASSTQTSIGLVWDDNSNNETGFRIERSASGQNSWTTLITTAANATSYSSTSLSCGTTYDYRVTATNAGGDSSSATASLTTVVCNPSALSNLHAASSTQTSIGLAWDDNSNNETGFRVEQAPSGQNSWTTLITTSADVTSYTSGSLTCGTTYDYRVTATNAGGDSSSATASLTTVVCNPSAPTSLHSTLANRIEISLAWTDNASNETGFKVERSAAGMNSWSLLATAAANAETFADTTVACGTSYDYRVIATNVGGDSSSATASGVASLGCAPNAPASPSPSNGATSVSLTPTLAWSETDPDEATFTYDVKLGTSNPPTSVVCDDETGASCLPGTLNPNTTYYWRVIVKDNHGGSTDGQVWSFTTLNRAPNTPSSPSPSNAATGLGIAPTLGWSGGDPDSGDSVTYDVFVSTTNPPPTTTPACGNVSAASCGLSGLSYSTAYYWQVVTTDSHGASTSSPVWSYTTQAAVPGLSASPASLSFVGQVSGTTSAGKTVSVNNPGTGTLTISAITPPLHFTIANSTCGSPVAPGGGCTFDVKFSPTTAGAKSGNVTIASDAPGSPHSVGVSGLALTTKAPPVLSTPKNGAPVTKSPAKLTWKAVKGATGYVVEIYDDPGLAAGDLVQTGNPPKETFTASVLPFGTYFWRVALVDSGGQSAFSAPFSFDMTLNKAPAKNSTTKSHLPKFSWIAVKNATYLLEVFTDPNDPAGSHAFDIQAPVKPLYSVPKTAPLPSGVYYWRVSIDGGSTWTPAWKLTIQ